MSQHDEQEFESLRRGRGGHGGARPGAGRKPKGQFAPLPGDVDYAKALVSKLMRDDKQPAELRTRCALAILIRGTSHRGSIMVPGAIDPVVRKPRRPPLATPGHSGPLATILPDDTGRDSSPDNQVALDEMSASLGLKRWSPNQVASDEMSTADHS